MLNLALKSATLICPKIGMQGFADAYNCFFDDSFWSLCITKTTGETKTALNKLGCPGMLEDECALPCRDENKVWI